MISRIFCFLLVLTGLILLVRPAFATNTPSFPTCAAPEGSQIASYAEGAHGIAGDSATHTGQDTVYSVSQNQALQCFCAGSNGIQTNWWKIGEMSFEEIHQWEKQGWVYIPDGSSWGLDQSAYLAYNLSYTCSGNSTPSSSGTGGGPSNSSTSAPECHESLPDSTPTITNVSFGQNSVTLTWTKAADPVSYYLVAYGTTPGVYTFGNPNVGNTTTYTIQGLSGNTTYYFVVRAVHNCMPGPFSNEVSSIPNGPYLSGPATGFRPTILGTQDDPQDNTLTKTICAACLWWPMLLGEIILITTLYLLARRKDLRVNRLLLGGAFAILAYIVFLLVNKGHVCPTGNITLWIFSLPCKYFWVFDAAILAILSWLIKANRPVISPVSPNRAPRKRK